MLSNLSRSLVVAGWATTLVIIVAVSVAMGAKVSTTGLLLMLGVVPAVIMLLLARAPSTSMREILYAMETKDGRS